MRGNKRKRQPIFLIVIAMFCIAGVLMWLFCPGFSDCVKNLLHIEPAIVDNPDKTAPVITSVPCHYLLIGEDPGDCKDNIVCEDETSLPEDLKIDIDFSDFDNTKTGTYFLDVTVSDAAGNAASAKQKIIVYEDPKNDLFFGQYDEELDQILEDVLFKIIDEGMTDAQKIKACFDWCCKNLTYKASHDYSFQQDFVAMAPEFTKKLLATKKGACFAYATLCAYMMNKLDIPVILVEGLGHNMAGSFELHYWTMIYCDGKWSHFDAMFTPLYKYKKNFCLSSSSYMYGKSHKWDKDKYPW